VHIFNHLHRVAGILAWTHESMKKDNWVLIKIKGRITVVWAMLELGSLAYITK
jgi:hypothetical protein